MLPCLSEQYQANGKLPQEGFRTVFPLSSTSAGTRQAALLIQVGTPILGRIQICRAKYSTSTPMPTMVSIWAFSTVDPDRLAAGHCEHIAVNGSDQAASDAIASLIMVSYSVRD